MYCNKIHASQFKKKNSFVATYKSSYKVYIQSIYIYIYISTWAQVVLKDYTTFFPQLLLPKVVTLVSMSTILNQL